MKAIVAVDEKWGIGKDKKLLVKIPQDLARFKELTLQKEIVMGKNTFLEMKKPLSNRYNIIISSTLNKDDYFGYKNLKIINPYKLDIPIEDYIYKHYPNSIIVGGSKIYDLFSKYITFYYVTKIKKDFNADSFITNLDNENYKKECLGKYNDLNNDLEFSYINYIRK